MFEIEGTDVLQFQVFGEKIRNPPPLIALYVENISNTVYVYRCTSCVILP